MGWNFALAHSVYTCTCTVLCVYIHTGIMSTAVVGSHHQSFQFSPSTLPSMPHTPLTHHHPLVSHPVPVGSEERVSLGHHHITVDITVQRNMKQLTDHSLIMRCVFIHTVCLSVMVVYGVNDHKSCVPIYLFLILNLPSFPLIVL